MKISQLLGISTVSNYVSERLIMKRIQSTIFNSFSRYAFRICPVQQNAVHTSPSTLIQLTSVNEHGETNDSLKSRQEALMKRGLPRNKPISGVKDVVLVVSGKGGVGKSTTAGEGVRKAVKIIIVNGATCYRLVPSLLVNIAAALAVDRTTKIGLLDADVFGPSIPLMMNLVDLSPQVDKRSYHQTFVLVWPLTKMFLSDNNMIPLVNYGVKCMSMGFLVKETSAIVWRGLMVMKALEQLTRQVDWSDTDCLVVDTPPGTGDTILSLIQTIPVSGVVLVTTPEKLAVQVAQRGSSMFSKLNIPIIGIVTNMSCIVCSNCQMEIPVFGHAADQLSKDLGVPILANVPLYYEKEESYPKPAVVSKPSSPHAENYFQIARKIQVFLNSSRE